MAQRQTTQRTATGSGFGTTAADLPTVADLHAAAERIGPYVHRTPVFTNSYLDAESGARLFFKAENLQKVGAFKMRGAANFVLQLSAAEARRGVVTHSSGNHGQAVAAAARARGVPATVVMPHSSSAVKRAAVAGYGARVVLCPDGDAARAAAAERIVAEQGATLIHPYGHPRIVAGQGTLALELFEQVAALDTVVAPVGGGGCLSGISVAARAQHPKLAVYGAEPAAADDAARSLAAGHIIPVEQPDTVADGLRTSLAPAHLRLAARQRRGNPHRRGGRHHRRHAAHLDAHETGGRTVRRGYPRRRDRPPRAVPRPARRTGSDRRQRRPRPPALVARVTTVRTMPSSSGTAESSGTPG